MRCADSNSLGYLPIKQRFTKQFASTSASLSVTPFARDTLLPKQTSHVERKLLSSAPI